MTGRVVQASINVTCSPATLFSALVTPSAIRQWWSANRAIVDARAGGYWMAAWGDSEDQPEYICGYDISDFEAPRRLEFSRPRYAAQSGDLPFDAGGIVVRFEVEETDSGCSLSVQQSGFPNDSSADDFYQGCQRGWQETLSQLKAFLE